MPKVNKIEPNISTINVFTNSNAFMYSMDALLATTLEFIIFIDYMRFCLFVCFKFCVKDAFRTKQFRSVCKQTKLDVHARMPQSKDKKERELEREK